MKNFPYLDQPFAPLVVAFRSMLAETEAPAGNPGFEKGPKCCAGRLQCHQASLMSGWMPPRRSTCSNEPT
jgi:hypothetical protein